MLFATFFTHFNLYPNILYLTYEEIKMKTN